MNKRFQHPFISLKHKNFRYYWIGMCTSLIGTWMQNIAQPWLAYQLTGSPMLLALVSAMQFLPMLLGGLFAGAIVERFSKKKILMLTQSTAMIITLVIAILTLTGSITYWHILISSALLGVVNAFDMPARQTFVVELVGKDDLQNAVSLNSMAFNVARIIGPAMAGIIMGILGVGSCFLINAISFGAVLLSLFFIRSHEEHHLEHEKNNIFKEIIDGIRYIRHHRILWNGIIVMAIVGTFAPNLNVLVPIYIREIFHSSELTFGFMMSLMGVGSFLGAMFTASLKGEPKRKIVYIFPVIIAILLIILGVSTKYVLFMIGIVLFGIFLITFVTTANSLLQFHAENRYRARVMSVYSLVFAGTTPIGNVYAGFISEHFGPQVGFVACGVIILLLMSWFYLFHYRKMKIN